MDPLKTGVVFQGRYEILECLGQGGMGAVYKAKQVDVNRTVALKVMHSINADNEEDVQRFRREAKSLARLQHTNIVNFYHYGFSDDGTPYAVMEYVRGRNLRKLLEESDCLPVDLAKHIMIQVCNALSFSHSLGVIHRDLKPENILVLDSPEPNTVKIIDFGLAKLTEKSGLATNRLTKTGMLIGSLHYMSPEQARGLPADERSDVYSCGVILFELLTGRKPFDADNPVGLLYKKCKEELPTFADLDRADCANSLVELACRQAMQVDPSQRIQSCEEMKGVLEGTRIIHASQLKRETKNKLVSTKNFFLAGVIALLLVLASLACRWIDWGSHPTKNARNSESEQSHNLERILADKPEKLTDEAKPFDEAKPSSSSAGLSDAMQLYDMGSYEECIRTCKIAARLYPNSAPLFTTLGWAYLQQYKLDLAIDSFDQALRIDRTYNQASFGKASALEMLGKRKEALRIYNKIIKSDSEAYIYFSLADCLRAVGETELARHNFSLALERATDPYCKACCLRELNRSKEAVEELSRFLESHPYYTLAWVSRSDAYFDLGEYQKALDDADACFELSPEPLSIESRTVLLNRAEALLGLRKNAEAMKCLNQIIQASPTFGDGEAYYFRAVLWRRLGKTAKASADESKARELGFFNIIERFSNLPK